MNAFLGALVCAACVFGSVTAKGQERSGAPRNAPAAAMNSNSTPDSAPAPQSFGRKGYVGLSVWDVGLFAPRFEAAVEGGVMLTPSLAWHAEVGEQGILLERNNTRRTLGLPKLVLKGGSMWVNKPPF